jgi:hypothetical protein
VDELLDSVTGCLGAKAVKVASAFRTNRPPGELTQGFAGHPMTCPGDRPILAIHHQPGAIARLALRACAPSLRLCIADHRQDAVAPLAQGRHIRELLLEKPSLLLAKIQPYAR